MGASLDRLRRSPAAVEAVIVSVVFVLCAIWGAAYCHAWVARGNQQVFYQNTFEPAVMIACGRGFVTSDPRPPALTDFLEQQRDAISCADVPSDPSHLRGTVYQRPVFYLMWFVGLAWRVIGISWSGMGPVFGVLLGGSAALAYALCRLAMGRVLALITVAGLATSTLHLWYVPQLRDFAKEPFTLALFYVIALLVTLPVQTAWVMLLGAVYGVVLAIAYGFRSDFLIDIPLFVIALALFLDGGPLRRWRLKLATLAVFAASFLTVGWPVLTSVAREGGCQWHTAILGAQTWFDEKLAVASPVYDTGYMYADGYVYAQVANLAARTRPPHPRIAYCSPEYDVASGTYLRTLVTTFPADFVTRAYASARTLAEAPFLAVDPPIKAWMSTLFQMRRTLMKPLRGLGIWMAALAILLAAAKSVRLGLFVLTAALYVGGYPALQFAARHYFHLEILAWLAAGFVLQEIVRMAWTWWCTRRVDMQALRVAVKRMAVVAACALAVIVVPLQSLRLYQAATVRPLLASYIAAPRSPLKGTSAPSDLVAIESRSIGPFDSDVIEVDVDRERCAGDASLSFVYDPAYPASDYSRTVRLPPARALGVTHVVFTAYEHFHGVTFPQTMAACVVGAYRLTDLRPYDVLVDATLPPGWDQGPLYQRLAGWSPVWFD
jgi:hypothetical protein